MEWYFDFISPYAYLQFKRLESLGLLAEFRLTPVLFAGLLNHWGQDATEMALQYRRRPAAFESDDRIIATLPVAAVRPQN